MKHNKRLFCLAVVSVIFACALFGCTPKGPNDSNDDNPPQTTVTPTPTPGASEDKVLSSLFSADEEFSSRDLSGKYYDNVEEISLSDKNEVTVSSAGTYVMSGTLQGRVIIDADKEDKVQLVLDGAEIISSSGSAIYVKSADKVFITLKEGTQNLLSASFANNINGDNVDGVIFSKSDLTLNGRGELKISSSDGHGVVSKDSLVVTGGKYEIDASGQALSGKDCVCVSGGEFNIKSGKDSVHSKNDDDEARGYVYITGGNFTCVSDGDGISSSSAMQIDGGTFFLTCGGGYKTFVNSSSSRKGIKASGELIIKGGEFDINSCDDGIHSNSDIKIYGGKYEIRSGDDGVHADSALFVAGGTIDIIESYEGLEGLSVEISDGDISINSSDDGINAAGGKDESGFGGWFGGWNVKPSSDCYIKISGGKLYIDADGDGVDSNGNLYVSGGETYILGPTSGMDGAIDFGENASAEITGGKIVAVAALGMNENFGESSTQGSIAVQLSGSNGSKISLTDSKGNELLSCTATKNYGFVLVSCPSLQKGGTYIVKSGNNSVNVTLTSLIYNNFSGGFGGPGGSGGGGAQRPGGRW